MWPDLFGPGWVWNALVSCSILAACIALVSAFGRPGRRPDVQFEAFQELWHRYEQGDLTRWEFERLRPARASQMFDRPAPPARYPQGLPSIRVPADAGPTVSSRGGA